MLRRSRWRPPWASLVSLAVLAAFAALVALVFWPGQSDPDTIGEWQEAQTGAYTDWHSPILSAMWRGLILLGLRSPGWVLAAGLLTLLVGIYLILRVQLARPAAALLACLVVAFPPVLGWAVHVGRDAWFASLLLCAFGVLLRSHRAEGRARIVLVVVAIVLGALAGAARQNAVPALVFFFAAVALHLWPRGRAHRHLAAAGVAVVATAAVFTVETAVSAGALHAQPSHPEQVVLDYDLAAMSRVEGKVLFPPQLYPKQDLGWLQRHSDVEQADSLEFGPDRVLTVPIEGAEYDLLRSTWLQALTGNPLAYLHDRLLFAGRLFGLDGDPALVYQWPLDPAMGAVASPWLNQHAVGYLSAFTGTGRPDSGTFIHRAWIYALALVGAAILWQRRRTPVHTALALCAVACLAYAAVTVFAAPSTYYRYLYVVVVAGTVAAVLLAAEAVPRLTGRLAGRGT